LYHLELTENDAGATEVQARISDTPLQTDNELSVKFSTSTSPLAKRTSDTGNCLIGLNIDCVVFACDALYSMVLLS